MFYYEYLSTWPEYCNVFETVSGAVAAYGEGLRGERHAWLDLVRS